MKKWLLLLSAFALFVAAQCPPKNEAPKTAEPPKETPVVAPSGNNAETGTGASQNEGKVSGQKQNGQTAPGSSPNSAPNQAQLDSIKMAKYKNKGKGKSPESKKDKN